MGRPTKPNGSRPAEARAALDLLRRILAHEQQRGHDDGAVVGGLGRFLGAWLARWPATARGQAEQLIAPLNRYAELGAAGREAAIREVLARSGQPVSAGERPHPDPRPAGEGTRTSSAYASGRRAAGDVAASEEITDPVGGRRGTAGPENPSRPDTLSLPPDPLLQGEPSAQGERELYAKDRSRSEDLALPRAPVPAPIAPLPAPGRRRERGSVVRAATPSPPSSDDPLGASVTTLRGVGSANAKRLDRLGIQTVHDLLYHFPRHHLDYRAAKLIRDLRFEGYETILASVWKVKVDPKPGGLLIIRVTLGDESGTAEAVWIRRKDYFSQDLVAGRTIVLSGQCRVMGGHPVFKDPEWEHFSGEDTVHTARLVPVYPLVEGLSGRFMRRLIKQTIDRYASALQDPLPASLRAAQRLIDLPQAVAQAHYPDSDELKAAGQRRLAFDELLVAQIGVLRRRRAWDLGDPAPALDGGDDRVRAFLGALPFQLTAAQQRALAAVRERLARTCPMSLLLEGDVGSGKTVVAAAAMVQAVANGYQAAIMAPTEILAEQHAKTLEKLLAGLGDTAPTLALLTGSLKAKERREYYAAIKDGQVDIVVGTQALVQEGLEFARLGLAIVDEQHRFGVSQRSVLRQKGVNPHVLVMTATPIPRTLALTLYGDLDLAIIDELPPGRQVIKTRHLRPTDRPKAYAFLRREVQEGHQAFVICPLVEESERVEARAATAEYERLRSEVFPDLRLGLLHGRMKAVEKDAVMRQFQRHELDVLVSTAVVEVGIDVPNATVMLIDGANRFGLAQLHQFRGRVGRGEAQAYCMLISDSPSETSQHRLDIMERTFDGFALAEEDLKLRGPGEFFGTRQSGLPEFKVARWGDVAVLEQAREAAQQLIGEDPDLAAPEHRLLRELVARFWQDRPDLN